MEPNDFLWQGDRSFRDIVDFDYRDIFPGYVDYNEIIERDYNGDVEAFEKDFEIGVTSKHFVNIPAKKSDNDSDEIPF